ncbi:phosphatidylinositol mannoside acyltransferase [Prauserella sp. PE36]|uniref:Phosphatidylinositol mannoside acyltransferase n=1 Tax=Prauserella endophytica TaxID=1592324 RepID=A0ABY2RY44_9PSEU|nr:MULTISPECIES: phosphatidylinositol mannoside acyltransferase [Prauserella]PXY23706.1 phosphatidylinositol mannoside acyltransferase [Prauserella coralliicola]RBM16761.1 phosphatidylinositol mannoside acyltransferase [Prauserella sp. PE36]TKG64908.1 phosphatidylinositol mannoside acyltransferase [Prauserella endophytica]
MSGLAGRLADLGYAAGWRFVPKLPAKRTASVFSFAADLAARRGGKGVRQLRSNLARVVPQADQDELDDLTRRAMRSYARYWHEAFRLPSLAPKTVLEHLDISGTEYLDAALAEGNGAVLALPHCGNWDVAGLWLVNHFGSFITVVERLEPESLYDRFVAFRESLGFEVVPSDGSVSFRALLRGLRDNKVVCLVGDRDLSNSGLPVTFFGEEARFPAGPARLAASTGAALLPVGIWFTDGGWSVRIHPRIRVNARDEIHPATQALAEVFAGDIAAHPTDWHMLQKFWVSDLTEHARVAG